MDVARAQRRGRPGTPKDQASRREGSAMGCSVGALRGQTRDVEGQRRGRCSFPSVLRTSMTWTMMLQMTAKKPGVAATSYR
eukprot:1394624-Amorphochlora_amoeboformis.AAC.2